MSKLSPSSLEQDIERMNEIAAGNREAFEAVLDDYMLLVFRFSFGIVQDYYLAEDITQETCLRLWNNAGSWRPTGRIKSWLLRIAHNLCMDELRSKKEHLEIEKFAETLSSNEPDPLYLLHDTETSKAVRRALFLLSERQRTALMLIHYSGCTNIEAADIMGVSVDAFESLLSRGRKTLRSRLEHEKDILLQG